MTTPIPGLQLRGATAADTEIILGMVRELAAYERLSHEVVADAGLLREALFGLRPAAEVILATSGGQPAGFALFFTSFSTFLGKRGLYLEDLFVRPAFRRRGIGLVLLARVAALVQERGYGRLEWSVLDWNEPAIGFYRRLGARPMDEWTVYRLTGPALAALARRCS